MIYPHGTPTQPEIIAVVLSKLELTPEDVFADLGCGSGSVAISASRMVKKVYAIDNRDEAFFAAANNLKERGITNASVLKGEAAELLLNIDVDCAFLGGSKNMEKVLAILIKKVPRFVVSAVRIEIAVQALSILKKNKRFRELLQIHILRGSALGSATMLKPENPVFLIVGGSC